MTQVVLANYGTGNLMSVSRALHHCGADFKLSHEANDIINATHLIIPGVGAFGQCMTKLNSVNLVASIQEAAKRGCYLLGICVGMQVLFDIGEEFGEHLGLGLIPGQVKKISVEHEKLPHIGWSQLNLNQDKNGTILADISYDDAFYFVHSYAGIPSNTSNCLASVNYGRSHVCAVCHHDRIYGTQFHPEKSGASGLKLLKKFLSLE